MLGNTRIAVTTSLACLIAACTFAQRTYIVDEHRGVGHHFRDLSEALAVVKAGDRVIVRRGSYSTGGLTGAVPIRVGITILCEPQALLMAHSKGPDSRLLIQDLPLGQTFVVKGLTIHGDPKDARSLLSIERCQGAVVVSKCFVAATVTTLSPRDKQSGTVIRSSRNVQLNQCELAGGLNVERSSVAITLTRLIGYHAELQRSGSVGLNALKSRIEVAQSKLAGGNSCFQFCGSSAPAVIVQDSDLYVVGDATAWIQAGIGSRGSRVTAIFGDSDSRLRIDPTVKVEAFGNAPAVVWSGKIERRRLPSLKGVGAGPGRDAHAELFAAPRSLFVLLAGRPGVPAMTTFGELWIDPRLVFLVGSGVIDATERTRFVFPVPRDAAFRGVPLMLQALAGATGLDFTPPVALVQH